VTKNRLILRSPAKVNLGLYLTDKRPDGYHELCSIFLPIEHSDFLDIELVDTGTLEIVSNPLGIFWDQCPCDSSNILHKAYIELSSFIKEKNKVNLPSVKVNILKNIPVEAGLGGGSSNAASFLKGMNELFELKLNKKELKQIGAKLGADVPFFIDQLPALVTGIGDIIEPFELKRDYWLVLIKPRQRNVPTPGGDRGFFFFFFFSSSLLPEIVDIKEYLKSLDPLVCMMTGSGAAVFGLFEKQPELDFKGLKDEWFFCTTKVLRGHYADHRN